MSNEQNNHQNTEPQPEDQLEAWIEELDNFGRQARKEGKNLGEPLLFSEIIPRMKALAKIFLEGGEPLEDELPGVEPQYVWVRATTAAGIRTNLINHLSEDLESLALFMALESDLSGDTEEEISKKIDLLRTAESPKDEKQG